MAVSDSQVLEALRSVIDPDLNVDIVTLGFIKQLKIDGGKVSFTIELTTPACPVKDELKAQAEAAVLALDGVTEVDIELSAQVRTRESIQEDLIPGVRQCIAIASGKGGVGKSTVTINLALALAETGARVGILDADVYGPSVPLMMGCTQERPSMRGQKIAPINRYGVELMSIGFLLEEGQAVLWRGPMVAGTVRQLLSDVEWGDLDYLLVDLPPGTGDAPMSLAQLAPLTGVVIVTTPHSVAASIAGKSAALFERLNTPVLGVIENMAKFVCPRCGETSRIFAGTSGENLASSLNVPFIGSIPLDPAIGQSMEDGAPVLISNPSSSQAAAFREVAGSLARHISILTEQKSGRTTGSFEPALSE